MRNFYSVSISGYHIAEAGANPISQLAFTLANGFTIVEYYLARGMEIDAFAPNLSFFFSNGMDPEYAVIGRVARRIWARAMRERYGASERSQMLKYHIQTSGRSLHAQEISFNDIRTTLQALYAIFDNTNSLHTNAYDEAITTPTEESVRRAVAIQLIINRELGLNFTENPWQGSFAIEALTDLVEDAVYEEFERISERGGVLGAMDTMYQRGKIQERVDVLRAAQARRLAAADRRQHLPAARGPGGEDRQARADALHRRGEGRPDRLVRAFQELGADRRDAALAHLRDVARRRENVFEALMDAVKRRLARPDLGRPLRGRRRVPAQHVASCQAMAARIVCLVPSITELLCDLGLAEQLVGRTGFCIHPWETVRTIPKVGGTKDLKFDRIRELEPTHVVVNVDENRSEDAEALAEFVPNVVVTHPHAPRDNLALYRQMGETFGVEAEAEKLCGEFEAAYERALRRSRRRAATSST